MAKIFNLNPTIPKGTEIKCPKCQKVLYTFIRNVQKTRYLSGANMAPRPDPKSDMKCPTCVVDFGIQDDDGDIKIHTNHGWILATA